MKYKVILNASMEIIQYIEAENKEEAEQKAYSAIREFDVYEFHFDTEIIQ